MSIPTWSYDEDFYRELTKHCGFEIRTDAVKGKGLFATRAFKTGEEVHVETALHCAQNVDDFLRKIPVCGHCLTSLESPRAVVARSTRNKQLAQEIPFLGAFNALRKRPIKCSLHADGCSVLYCSERCRSTAWDQYHHSGCRGVMDADGKSAFDTFASNSWQQGGIDYSDTHFLSLRFMSGAVSRTRLHKQPPGIAYAHIEQLIKANLSMFNFSFLLHDEAGEDESDHYSRFLKFKDEPAKEPFVIKANEEGPSKPQMLSEGMALLDRMFKFTPKEKAHFTDERWSSLLGAVLLNGQERSPNSQFAELVEMANAIPDGADEMKSFNERCKSLDHDPKDFHTSSRGQGIYTVGCLFNHSCRPNIQVHYSPQNDETLNVISMRDIALGDELCISYIDEDMPLFDRRQQLYEHYLFTCCCEKCREQSETSVVDTDV